MDVMAAITHADRVAAEELRVLLADKSGFWHLAGDMGPICLALSKHREVAERRIRQEMELAAQGRAIALTAPGLDALTALPKAREPRARLSGSPVVVALPSLPKAAAL